MAAEWVATEPVGGPCTWSRVCKAFQPWSSYPNFDFYFNAGAEFASRAADSDSGYRQSRGPRFSRTREPRLLSRNRSRLGWVRGALANCMADTTVLTEGTAGFLVRSRWPVSRHRKYAVHVRSHTTCRNRTFGNRDPQTVTRTSIQVPLFFFTPAAWSPQGAEEWSILTFPQALPEGDNACN